MAILGRTKEKLKQTVRQIENEGRDALAIEGDVSRYADMERVTGHGFPNARFARPIAHFIFWNPPAAPETTGPERHGRGLSSTRLSLLPPRPAAW